MVFSRWIVPEVDRRNSGLLQKEFGLPAITADILSARHCSPAEVSQLLGEGEDFSDPFLLPDMDKAVRRINAAIDQDEKITVYGDYDCDGVTATVLLCSYLQSMGVQADWYIPERQGEGYGLNMAALDEISARGTTLLITVDNGISALEEIAYAGTLGMDVVVTDHHQVGPELPKAVAVVDPHRKDYRGEFAAFCGAGVALKLVAALEGGDFGQAMDSFGALAAIATVGDIVPLAGENRRLVTLGLPLVEYSDNLGLQALLEVSGMKDKPVTSQKIAFGLVPRVNAAGRMGSAKLALQLFVSEDPEEAAALAAELDEKNRRRQEEEEEILAKALDYLAAHSTRLLDRVLVIPLEGVNHGVVGIVSAKLVSLYGKPNIILSVDGDMATGSARSVETFSMFKAVSACKDLLEKFGGHSMAAGLSLKTENIPGFTRKINSYAAEFHDKMPAICQKIDKELHAGDINLNDVSALQQLEPFGEGNPQPVFLLKNCRIEAILPMSEDRHLKLRVNFEGRSIHILYFRMSSSRFVYPVGAMVDILANLEISVYRGNASIAIRLKDIRPSDFNESKFYNARHFYEKIRRGEQVESKIMAISVPTLAELRWLYKFLRDRGGSAVHADLFYLSAAAEKMNYCKYRLILDIFAELSLVSIPPDYSKIEMLACGKVDLEQSAILTGLRRQS